MSKNPESIAGRLDRMAIPYMEGINLQDANAIESLSGVILRLRSALASAQDKIKELEKNAEEKDGEVGRLRDTISLINGLSKKKTTELLEKFSGMQNVMNDLSQTIKS